ncbi:hypothetical protein B484DRAFT_395556 [Ochromonadaceae sp. CCMP2298]|nr:hypothetical protein B484DRAFT_395556 [Ochromonadaceae sp. CCMP2298]
MIFTLAVVLATYHLTDDEYVGVELTAGPLSVMVNAIKGNDHADFCVDSDYLGHALLLVPQLPAALLSLAAPPSLAAPAPPQLHTPKSLVPPHLPSATETETGGKRKKSEKSPPPTVVANDPRTVLLGIAHYADHGMPTLEDRTEATEATSADDAISYRAEAKLKLAVYLCELIASAQSGSKVLTPAKQLVCGPMSAKLIVDGYLRQLQQKLQNRVDELRGIHSPVRQVAVLMTFFEKPAPTGVEPACFTFDFVRIELVTCGNDTELMFMLDTEYILNIAKQIYCEGERLKNVYLVSPIFHIRMHVLANLTNDPVNLVLIWCPLLFALGLQRDKMKAKEGRVQQEGRGQQEWEGQQEGWGQQRQKQVQQVWVQAAEAGSTTTDEMLPDAEWLVAAWSSLPLVDLAPQVRNSWGSALAVDVIESGLKDLGIDPVADIILKGSAAKFVENIHRMAQYLANCRRDKVVRSLFVVIASLDHGATVRPDLLEGVFLNCTRINDMFIENSNSATRNALTANCLYTPSMVARAAQCSELKREMLPKEERDANITPQTSSRGKGEVYHEETRHTRAEGAADRPIIATWLRSWLLKLASLTEHFRPPAEMDTIAGQLRHGVQRINEAVLPKYKLYLEKMKRKHIRDHGLASVDGYAAEVQLEKTYLDGFTNPSMEAFLRAQGERGLYKLSKDGLKAVMLSKYSMEEFCTSLDKGIDTLEDATAAYKELGTARTTVRQQQEQQLPAEKTAIAEQEATVVGWLRGEAEEQGEEFEEDEGGMHTACGLAALPASTDQVVERASRTLVALAVALGASVLLLGGPGRPPTDPAETGRRCALGLRLAGPERAPPMLQQVLNGANRGQPAWWRELIKRPA